MPAARDETDVLEHEVKIAARPETVFGFFTDPTKIVRWIGTEATLDPRPGGVCRVDPNGNGAMLGEFVEVEPHRRIVITWGWEQQWFAMPPQSSVVEILFIPDGADTIVRLAHRRLPPAATAFHDAGWTHYLPRLAVVAAGGDPGPDPWRDLDTAMEALGDSIPGAD